MTEPLTGILNKDRSQLLFRERSIACSCHVRNELNGLRGGQDVAHSMPDGKPYMPRQFPSGRWKLGKPVKKTDPYMAPWFIPTDAFQYLPTWELDEHGFYVKPTAETVKDIGYGIHLSTSSTTLGCLKLVSMSDLNWLVNLLQTGTEVYMEVL